MSDTPILQFMGCGPVMVRYTNYRNETAERRIQPITMRWGSTEWHPEPGWLVHAIDCERGVRRDFALKDMCPVIGLELTA